MIRQALEVILRPAALDGGFLGLLNPRHS
jgi:hypothetical protein